MLENHPQSEALNWLLEMELVNHPYVINTIILNVLRLVRGLKDIQFVADMPNKKLLIYLEVRKLHVWFRKKRIEADVLEMLDLALPTFKKRVVFDKTVLGKALKILEERNGSEN